MNTHLLVPVTGPIAVLQGGEALERMSHIREQGWLIIEVSSDGLPICNVVRLVDPLESLNVRAAQVFLELTELHMIFTGPVLFGNLDSTRCFEMVRKVS